MGSNEWIEGSKEIIIGGVLIGEVQRLYTEVYSLGGMVDSIDPAQYLIKAGVETMVSAITIMLIVFGVFLVIRGMKTAITNW